MAQILSIELSNERWLEVVPEGRFTVVTAMPHRRFRVYSSSLPFATMT